MADEQAETVVNEGEAASTSASEQAETANPQSSGSTGAESTSDKRVPYERFHEVVREKNEYKRKDEERESRIRELESRLGASGSAPQRPDVIEAQVQRLVKDLGMEEKAARVIASTSHEISSAKEAEFNARMSRFEVAEWERSFEAKNPDYKELSPEMEKRYNALTPAGKKALMASPEMVELLYGATKALKASTAASDAAAKATEEAYKIKGLKSAVSSQSGTGSGAFKKALTLQDIHNGAVGKMTTKEFQERQSEINQLLAGK